MTAGTWLLFSAAGLLVLLLMLVAMKRSARVRSPQRATTPNLCEEFVPDENSPPWTRRARAARIGADNWDALTDAQKLNAYMGVLMRPERNTSDVLDA